MSENKTAENTKNQQSDNILEVSHLKKYFPIKGGMFGKQVGAVKAVDDVSFTLKRGTTMGLVGESGCGKSTTGRTILRLIEKTDGQVLFNGKDVYGLSNKEMRDMRTKMQIIFQDPYSSLSPRLPVGEIIGEAVREHNLVPKSEYADYVTKIMDDCGLQSYHKDRYPHEFSGGQRQRICIARALALNPEFVVCDEPVSALDVSVQAQIINLLKELQKKRNLTYLFISHDLSVVEHISDTIGVMYLGGLVETGTTADIFANPQSEVAKELIRKDTGSDIGADSRLDAVREKGQAEIKSGEKIRIVFSENSAFEPVIANLILTFGEPVNILKADTKNVGGVAKGEMILEFMEGSTRTEMMKQYLKEKGLAIGEVTEYVGS